MLTSEYNLWKSQINEEDAARVTFDQYRKAVSYVGDYDYKSIRDKQIGRELVFKIGVYTVAAIVAVPCVLTGNAPGALLSFSIASYVCGSTSVTGAITGTNPISGRTISSDERWVEGISGGVQVLSGAYGVYAYGPQAFANILNTPAPPIRSVADIVDDVAKEGSDAVDDVTSGAKTVETPYGPAIQDISDEALGVRHYVEQGGDLYRGGTLGRSNVTDAQFWAKESPLSPGYAHKYGVDFDSLDYIIKGKIKPGTNFVTRPAPGLGSYAGGAIEIVTPPNSVDLDFFYMLGGK